MSGSSSDTCSEQVHEFDTSLGSEDMVASTPKSELAGQSHLHKRTEKSLIPYIEKYQLEEEYNE